MKNWSIRTVGIHTCRAWQLGTKFLPLDGISGKLSDVILVDADEHVLRLDVRVYNLALGVQVVKALQNLQ